MPIPTLGSPEFQFYTMGWKCFATSNTNLPRHLVFITKSSAPTSNFPCSQVEISRLYFNILFEHFTLPWVVFAGCFKVRPIFFFKIAEIFVIESRLPSIGVSRAARLSLIILFHKKPFKKLFRTEITYSTGLSFANLGHGTFKGSVNQL